MIIDKSKKITKILGCVCALSALLGIVLTIRGFVLYRLIVALSEVALAFVCLKGIGKDREIFAGVFGLMAVFEVVRVLMEESLTIKSGIFLLVRIAAYVVITAYILGYIDNKIIPIIAGIVLCLLFARNVYNVFLTYRNMMALTGGKLKLTGAMILNYVGVASYMVPPAVVTILISVGAMKITK